MEIDFGGRKYFSDISLEVLTKIKNIPLVKIRDTRPRFDSFLFNDSVSITEVTVLYFINCIYE
jgi:hypothetical protein